jgi:arsenite-transporting ATPase
VLLSGPRPVASPAALASQRRVLFVGGKGGVGKTSVASALALGRAGEGARVLLVSTDPAHNLGHLWGGELGDSPQRLAEPGGGVVDGIEIDPAATVERHLAAVRGTMRRLLPEHQHAAAARHLELARDAPGTHESAVLERVADCVALGTGSYDLVVFDTAPSGHTLRLMTLPEKLTTWTESLLANRDRSERLGAAVRGLGGGEEGVDRDAELRRVLVRRRERFATLRTVVGDPATTSFVLVLVAERIPVLETAELHDRLRATGVDVGALVVNRRSPAGSGPLLEARRRLEEDQLAELRRRLPRLVPHQVPLLPGEVGAQAALAELAVLLGASSN